MVNIAKKGFLCLLVFCMLLGSISGYAADMEKELFDLTSLGIMQGDENGEMHLEDQVTRAEFAAMMLRLTKMEDLATLLRNETLFDDVPVDEWYNGYVNGAVNAQYMEGYAEGNFGPNDPVTFEQAAKVLVIILGYEPVAQQNGGYPDGYTLTAATTGLTKGADIAEPFTRGMLAKMLYNALDIDKMNMTVTTGGQPGYEVVKGDTLRQNLENDNVEGNLYKQRGIVTANSTTWLETPIAGMQDDEVEISGVIYKVGNTNATDYIGQEVDFYSETDSADRLVVRAIKASKNTSVQTFDASDIESFTQDRLQYYDAESSRSNNYIKLGGASAKFVYNSSRVLESDNSIFDLQSGTVTAIDNTGDEVYDVILINEFESARVDRVNEGGLTLVKGQTIFNDNKIVYDADDRDKNYDIRNAEGQVISFSDIKEDDIVSASISGDKNTIQLKVSSNRAEGAVSELLEDSMVMDGVEYEIEDGKTFEVQPGDSVVAYLNYQGKIADLEKGDTKEEYGYVVEVGNANGMGNLQLKLCLGGPIREDIEIDDSDEDNIIEKPILKVQNKEVVVLDAAPGMTINGEKKSSQEVMEYFSLDVNKLIRYNTNGKGEISRIESPQRDGIGEYVYYNAYEKVFGGLNDRVFAVDDTTKVICVSADGAPVEEDIDYLSTMELNDGQRYSALAYDLDEKTKVAGVIVVEIPMDYYAPGVINNLSKVAVAAKITSVTTEDLVQTKKVTFYSEGKEMTYNTAEVFADDTRRQNVENLQVGDVFFYSLNQQDQIDNVQVLKNVKNNPVYGVEEDDGQKIYGRIVDIEYNELNMQEYRRVHRVTLETNQSGSQTQTVDINARNTPYIYQYDTSTKEVSVIDIYDITAGLDDEMFVYDDDGIKAVVVVK